MWLFNAITPANKVVRKFLLEGLECYNDTQMKAHIITKLTDVPKATMYSTEIKFILLLLFCFGAVDRSSPEALH